MTAHTWGLRLAKNNIKLKLQLYTNDYLANYIAINFGKSKESYSKVIGLA